MKQYRKNPSQRREIVHRVLFYISQRTSPKYPEWRDATIRFLWDLYQIRDRNPAILLSVHKDDGIYVYHDATPVAYFHIRPQHILVHAAPGYLLWSKKNRPFKTVHHGSWRVMWRCSDVNEIDSFIRIVGKLPVVKPRNESSSRCIPQQVREFVLERDEGKCRVCKSTTNLHFDHILPFCRGGDNTTKNVQILCGPCNLQKGATQGI